MYIYDDRRLTVDSSRIKRCERILPTYTVEKFGEGKAATYYFTWSGGGNCFLMTSRQAVAWRKALERKGFTLAVKSED
jgi:hypothetical protein